MMTKVRRKWRAFFHARASVGGRGFDRHHCGGSLGPLRGSGLHPGTGRAGGFAVRYDNLVGAGAHVPEALQHSLFRTVQEALANVRRHSSAQTATVFVRVDRRAEHGFGHGYAEVEVLDDGRPLTGTSGSGLGLLGVRERLATHGGVSEIGPRVTGGYRVRVRMPLPEESS